MNNINFFYKSSIDTSTFENMNKFVENLIAEENNSEFNYLSLSIRNHRINLATSIPSNKNVVADYIKNGLIELDPLACFERFTNKKILTFSEVKKYKNNGKCGKTYMDIRKKSGLIHGFHYIHRHQDWSFTVVFGSDFIKNGFAIEEDLVNKNTIWLNNVIKKSLLFLNKNRHVLIQDHINSIDHSSIVKNTNLYNINKVLH